MTEQEALQYGYTPEEIAAEKKRKASQPTQTQQNPNWLARNESWARPTATTIGGITGGALGSLLPIPVAGSIGGAGAGEALVGAGYDELSGRGASIGTAGEDAAYGTLGGVIGPALKTGVNAVPKLIGKATQLGSEYFNPSFIGQPQAIAGVTDVVKGLGANITKAERFAYQKIDDINERFKAAWDTYQKSYNPKNLIESQGKMGFDEFRNAWTNKYLTPKERVLVTKSNEDSALKKATEAISRYKSGDEGSSAGSVIGGLLSAGTVAAGLGYDNDLATGAGSIGSLLALGALGKRNIAKPFIAEALVRASGKANRALKSKAVTPSIQSALGLLDWQKE